MTSGVIIRNVGDDASVLMTLASVLSSLTVNPASVNELLLVDGSDTGLSVRANDLLNMFRHTVRRVFVLRMEAAPHNKMLVEGLRFAWQRDWDRLHHFDSDVVVLPKWFACDWLDGTLESLQLHESSSLKGFITTTPGLGMISAAGFTMTTNLLSDQVFATLEDYPLGILEDLRLCEILSEAPQRIRPGIGLYHCTRDTGGGYVARLIDAVKTGRLPLPER